ncbi:hypothetical protein [Clostridium aminobutyricum]|uniref:Uncharacterized protein n=1 Tax=Clostridium aminobutyricum TaxID=33953 RepID=A0A939D767_CLOAM|nr:hypothetical protein [Clostridium aminobutyricum]MBN7772341.1 hypothetical protein [Clostridium aminobutyricum]
MYELRNQNRCWNDQDHFDHNVNIPVELYESMKGEYFIGCASDTDLHVNEWTITNYRQLPFSVNFGLTRPLLHVSVVNSLR